MALVWGAARAAERSTDKTGTGFRISQEWASQLKVHFEKASAAASAVVTGVARLCCTCRTKSEKANHPGRNDRKGQCAVRGITSASSPSYNEIMHLYR